MNLARVPVRSALALAAAGLVAACSSAPVPPATPATTIGTAAPTGAAAPRPSSAAAAPAGAAGPARANATAAASPSVTATDLPAHLDPASPISRDRLVFFDFNSDALDAVDRALIEIHARYLVGARTLTIRVEGHADERGGSEYNLALGQRRAEAVQRALSLLGVGTERVEAASWGEERPLESGQNEQAWSRNRRAELVYPR